jgi:hypothetical protein
MFRISLVCALALLAAYAGAQSPSPFSPMVHPPGAGLDGRSARDLAADWWQWALSAPEATHPIRDTNGVHCGVGQGGNVWFLAGGFGSSKVRRVCTVPAGKTLFFPLVNMVYWPRNLPNYTCDRAKASAALNNDTAMDLFAEIDGQAVPALKSHRVTTDKCFNAFGRIPADQRPYDAYPAASDGYWLMVKPLPPGVHRLKFGGRYNRNSPEYGRMVQDIEYELVVR